MLSCSAKEKGVLAETYTIEQLQKILKLSERTILRLLKNGKLTGFKAGREWRFQESDINAYIQAQRQEAEKERLPTQN
jgi:excisionase family DNA binding protein